MWIVIRSGETPSTSEPIWISDDAWPPPMSGTAIRITSVPSSSKPIQALDQSLSQMHRP
jgi:hypothetical protein